MNAIGINFFLEKNELKAKIIDPFNGVKDLENCVLNLIDDNFFKDPVRFLRMIRFHLKFNFKISDNIKTKLMSFNLSKLTIYYLKSEYQKSKNINFFRILFSLIETHHIVVNPEILQLKSLEKISDESFFLSEDLQDLCCAIYGENELQKIANLLAFKFKDLKRRYLLRLSVQKIMGHELLSPIEIEHFLNNYDPYEVNRVYQTKAFQNNEILLTINSLSSAYRVAQSKKEREFALEQISQSIGKIGK